MKKMLLILVLLVIASGIAYALGGGALLSNETPPAATKTQDAPQDAAQVTPGTYVVDAQQSEFNWAGQKPLIDGYVNSGTIGLASGTIIAGENTASGEFTLDMNTLQVGLTATKPGQEGALEGHLKGERWFDVATHPTAKFVITDVQPMSGTTYTVTGDLTMKGQTHAITFPAQIYQSADGLLHAQAQTEIDRTKWGITSGSDNFFENLGDNAIDDMVAISFHVIAQKQ